MRLSLLLRINIGGLQSFILVLSSWRRNVVGTNNEEVW